MASPDDVWPHDFREAVAELEPLPLERRIGGLWDLLLARLGPRGCEVAALELDDIDWRAGLLRADHRCWRVRRHIVRDESPAGGRTAGGPTSGRLE